MKKYVAKRKDVCAGMLLKTDEENLFINTQTDKEAANLFINAQTEAKLEKENIDNEYTINDEVSEDDLAKRNIINIEVFCASVCRGMLFNVNENGLANDLIYTTPTNYPISGIEPKIDVDRKFIIDDYVELEELLKYLKYGVDLTQSDLNQIYKKFITRNWWLEHHLELFGWEKLGQGSYGSGGIETIPKKIYDNLSSISCFENGNPNKEEPGYRYIMRKTGKKNNLSSDIDY